METSISKSEELFQKLRLEYLKKLHRAFPNEKQAHKVMPLLRQSMSMILGISNTKL